MPRRSRSTGVGRGNGLGSAKTQFREGMPSGNPNGRPKKSKEAPPTTLLEALARALADPIPVTVNGQRQSVPQYQMLVMNMLAKLPDATMAQQIAAMKLFVSLVPSMTVESEERIPAERIEEVVARLAEEHRRCQRVDEMLAARGVRPN